MPRLPAEEKQMTAQEAYDRVDFWMRTKYRRSLSEMEITDTPGYWRDCEAQIHEGHPLHSCIGCDGPFKATYTYFDEPRAHGRFASTTRSWRLLRDASGPVEESSTGGEK